MENQRGRVIKAIKAEKEAREEGIRIQEKIDEIRYQRREGKSNGGGAQDEIDEDEVDAKIVQEQINKIYDECGDERQEQAASLCQDAIQSALRSKRQRWAAKGTRPEWIEIQRVIRRTASKIDSESKESGSQSGEGIKLSNCYAPLAVDEHEIEDVFQAEDTAYNGFKAMLTMQNLQCRRTRRALATKAIEDAKRKHRDVLEVTELCKEIEEAELRAEEAEAKKKEKEEDEWDEENEDEEEDDEEEEEEEDETTRMDTARRKSNNRPRKETDVGENKRRSRADRSRSRDKDRTDDQDV